MNKVEACLTEIGVPANIQGFGYLCDAIEMVNADWSLIGKITKQLYPEITKKRGVTKSSVERGMRLAIESAFNRWNPDIVHKYFGNTVDQNRGKLTNSQFIAGLALYLRDDLNAENNKEE